MIKTFRKLMAIVLVISTLICSFSFSASATNSGNESVEIVLPSGGKCEFIFEFVDDDTFTVSEVLDNKIGETLTVDLGSEIFSITDENNNMIAEADYLSGTTSARPYTVLNYIKKGTIMYNQVNVESVPTFPRIEFWYAQGQTVLNGSLNLNNGLTKTVQVMISLIAGSISFITPVPYLSAAAAAILNSLVSSGVVLVADAIVYGLTRNEVTVNYVEYFCKGRYNGSYSTSFSGTCYEIVDTGEYVYEGMCPQEWTDEYNAQQLYGCFLTIMTYPGVLIYEWE